MIKKPGWQISKKELLTQGVRYLSASVQDQHPAYGLTHASYARLIFEALAYEGDYFPNLLRKAGELQEIWTEEILRKSPIEALREPALRAEVEKVLGRRMYETEPQASSGLEAGGSEVIAIHIRQIRRYAFAALQDKSPVVGLTHASYALILLDTLEEIVGSEAITKTGMDPRKLRTFIVKIQDKHAEALAPRDPHLSKILEIERREGIVPPGLVEGGAWPAPGFALPARGFVSLPHGFAATPRTRIISA